MYKKRTGFYILCILIVAVMLAMFLPAFGKAKASAKAEVNLTESVITDTNLYRMLQQASREQGTGASLTDQTFKDTTELDLSYTSVGVPSDSKKITDITALREFDLRNLKVLKLSNNALVNIDANIFEGMLNLEYLDLANNGLTSIDLSMLNNLRVLIINNNEIDQLDVTNLVTTGYNDGDSMLNVSNNPFKSISDIDLPAAKTNSRLQIIGYNNNFTDITALSSNGFTYQLGAQGFGTEIVEISAPLKYYNIGDDTLSAKIFKITKGENGDNVETLVKTLADDPNMPISTISLGVGNYRIDYFKDNVLINSSNNDTFMWFESREFSVVPNTPEYYFKVGNKTYYDIDKLTRVGTLHIVADKNSTVYYSIGGSNEWKEGSEITLDRGGAYIVQFKCVVDGVESKIQGVTINASANIRVPDIFMALLVVGMALVFVAVIYFVAKYLQRR